MTIMLARRQAMLAALCAGLGACGYVPAQAQPRSASAAARKLIGAARGQVGVTLAYDPAYTAIAYPGGDVNRAKGVCTDVVIRAYRDAFGIDLQRQVHEDMARAFAAYPKNWGLKRPDSNIDHRRVPNLATFWSRAGARQPLPAAEGQWQPGDIFTSLVGGNLPHTGIVSDRLSLMGEPMVIHNIGGGTREESINQAGRITGRFRWNI